jgi:hypothetical protein
MAWDKGIKKRVMWMVSGLVMELLDMELLEFGLDSYRDWNLVIGIW